MKAGQDARDLLRIADMRRDLDPLTKALAKALRQQLALVERSRAESADLKARAVQFADYSTQVQEWAFGEAGRLVTHAREQLQAAGCTEDVLRPSLQSLDDLLGELRLRAVANDELVKAYQGGAITGKAPPATPRAPGARMTRPRRAALALIEEAEQRGKPLTAADLCRRLRDGNITHRETARKMGEELVKSGLARIDDTGRQLLSLAK